MINYDFLRHDEQMAETIANLLIIFGNPLAYRIGRLIITILSFGKLSIEPLPDKYPASFVQAFDDDNVIKNEGNQIFSVKYEITMFVGYALLLTAFGFLLFYSIT